MEYRPPHAGPTQRPQHPHIAQQRAMSGSTLVALQQQQQQQQLRQHQQPAAWRPPHPSHLSNIRSVSQPGPASAQLFSSNSVDNIASGTPSHQLMPLSRNLIGQTFTTSPEVINLDDDDDDESVRPPLAKRLKVDAEQDTGLVTRALDGLSHNEREEGEEAGPENAGRMTATVDTTADAMHTVAPGAPLPRVSRMNVAASGASDTSGSTLRNRDAERARIARKAGGSGLDPPTMATRTSARQKVTDFYPWAGCHPEDVLNETVIKLGYADKAPPGNSTNTASSAMGSQTPTGPGTANPELNSALSTFRSEPVQKKHVALAVLGQIFTSIIDRRNTLSRYSSASHQGFKPPPRVTITDSKREAWLRDLANPEVPLRKQSRNIPYGIRGKSLLEQCLAKGIPLPRAVWLAKCVGSNELRAFRRKGTAGAGNLNTTPKSANSASVNVTVGETKWVREWTLHVQQFLESIVSSCGQQQQQSEGWHKKMDYGIRLSASFYSECLLDKECFLDWIVNSFAAATMDKLPLWTLMVQLYWKDIIPRGRRGRTLAKSILGILDKFQTHRPSNSSTTMALLETRVRSLLTLLVDEHRSCAILPRSWQKFHKIFACSIGPKSTSSTNSSSKLAQRTYAHTSRAILWDDIQRRNQRLVATLTKTAARTRGARSKLFAALDALGTNYTIAHVLAEAQMIVPNAKDLVHALLDHSSSIYRVGQARIFLAARLIVALRQAGHETDAAILDYLRKKDTTKMHQMNVFRLLTELASGGSFAVGRYFQWIMTSGIVSTPNAGFATGLLYALRRENLPGHLQGTRDMLLRRLQNPTAIEVGAHVEMMESTIVGTLNGIVAADSASSVSDKIRVLPKYPSRLSLSGRRLLAEFDRIQDTGAILRSFCVLRDVFEETLDQRSLLELVSRAAKATEDTRYLATVVDTICRHAASYAALSQLEALVELSIASYREMRTQQPLNRSLICSMRALAVFLPVPMVRESLRRYLSDDLAICDQQGASAVCSPASDSLINMSATNLESNEDIDAVFASGNVMDEQLMRRVFMRIVQRTDKEGIGSDRLCSWLGQLRLLDSAHFEQILQSYIRTSCDTGDNLVSFLTVTRALVASECMSLDTILTIITDSASPASASIALRLLAEDSSTCIGLHSTEKYRFSVRREAYCQKHQNTIFRLVGSALSETKSYCKIQDLASFFLMTCSPDSLDAFNVVDLSTTVSDGWRRLLTAALEHKQDEAPERAEDAANLTPEDVVRLADPLSIHLCAKLLALMSQSCDTTPDGQACHVGSGVQAAVLEAVKGGCDVWSQLLLYSGSATINKIFRWSRDEVLAHLTGSPIEHDLNRILDILDVSYHETVKNSTEDTSAIITILAEKLRLVDGEFSASKRAEDRHCNAQECLHILLHLVVLYSSGLEAKEIDVEDDSDSESVLYQNLQSLLASLGNLLLSSNLQQRTDSFEYVADVAGFLADHLPETVRIKAAQMLSVGAILDAHLLSILALPAGDDIWLALATTPQTLANANNTSQQQRLLAKQASVSAASAARQSSAAASQQPKPSMRCESRESQKVLVPFPLRSWEVLPSVGGTDSETSLNLSLFSARKVR